jgi:hypothetical protein
LQPRPIKVLLIDSDDSYVDELQDGFAEGQGDLALEQVAELRQALARLSQGGCDSILMS